MITNAIQSVAIAKAIATKDATAAREQLTVGKHEVDVTVRITGSLNVFADTEKTPTVSMPMKEVLALFIRYSGITGPHALALLKRAMTDALTKTDSEGSQNTQGEGAIAAVIKDIDETINLVVEPMLQNLPKTPVKGMVKPNLKVTTLEGVLV